MGSRPLWSGVVRVSRRLDVVPSVDASDQVNAVAAVVSSATMRHRLKEALLMTHVALFPEMTGKLGRTGD